ncbi:hypothetical protein OU997_16115 [Pseudomonas sp. SL4(2022)]|uniref:hypothetical protein n=1 Tax=unclassified Pseudomonas TaxID=196821 RepID=UPI0011B20007|nr:MULTISPECIES: hypothetical protein [unclassified Pseudomonas]WAC43760.1 hypothetical protein OU997_16115 [Pseudomonas sp. SL4(2022)]
MNLLKPSKQKITTAIIFITLSFAFFCADGLMKMAYQKYMDHVFFSGDLSSEYEAIRSNLTSREELDTKLLTLLKKVPPEAYAKVEVAAKIRLWSSVGLAMILAYIGGCLAHRKSQQRNAT